MEALIKTLIKKGMPHEVVVNTAMREDAGLIVCAFYSSSPYFLRFLHNETLSILSICAATVLFPPTFFKTQLWKGLREEKLQHSTKEVLEQEVLEHGKIL